MKKYIVQLSETTGIPTRSNIIYNPFSKNRSSCNLSLKYLSENRALTLYVTICCRTNVFKTANVWFSSTDFLLQDCGWLTYFNRINRHAFFSFRTINQLGCFPLSLLIYSSLSSFKPIFNFVWRTSFKGFPTSIMRGGTICQSCGCSDICSREVSNTQFYKILLTSCLLKNFSSWIPNF